MCTNENGNNRLTNDHFGTAGHRKENLLLPLEGDSEMLTNFIKRNNTQDRSARKKRMDKIAWMDDEAFLAHLRRSDQTASINKRDKQRREGRYRW